MSDQTKHKRETFTFSLGGMAIKNSTMLMPAIAHDRINRALDEKLQKARPASPDTGNGIGFWGRFWLRARARAAQS